MDLRAYLDTATGTWRCDGVPIVTTGIEYPLSTGPKTFTEDDLVDIVASQNDSAIKPARIKLGHSSEYNAALVGDAEQAFGRVENMRIGNQGQTVYGDYVGMPEWLANVLPIAYPSRSIEGWPDVKTNTGHEYRAVVSAVSLLGIEWPGVSTLEDLPLYYGSEIPPGVTFLSEASLAAKNGGRMPGDRIRAAVDIDLIERAFYTEYAQGDQYWWWIRGERFDDTSGLQLIVDCDPDATLVRVPVSVAGSDISFGDPVEVTEEYPDKSPVAAAAFMAGSALASGADVIVYASRADTTQDRPAIRATQEGGVMDEATRRALAARVGLDPETATEDEINTAIDELRADPAAGDGGDGGDGEGAGEPAANEPVGIEAGAVMIDRERLAQLEAGANTAQQLRAEQVEREDDAYLAAAIGAGKFSPARKEHYKAMMKADREGAKVLIDGLFEGTIPMEERGASGNSTEIAGGGAADDGLLGMDVNLDRDIRAARTRQVAGGHGRVTQAKEA